MLSSEVVETVMGMMSRCSEAQFETQESVEIDLAEMWNAFKPQEPPQNPKKAHFDFIFWLN